MNYKEQATEARKKVLQMIHRAGTSHIGSNFSIIDIATVLYDEVDLSKDRVLFSKGWAAATLYYFLAKKGVIPKEDLDTFCQPGSKYIGLAEPNVKGVDAAGGSMGYGLPFGVGYALSKKLKGEEGTVYVIMSDGEMAIGTTSESLLLATQLKLDNLVVIIDGNGFQAMGKTKEVLDIVDKQQYFWGMGAVYYEIDGHNFEEIDRELQYIQMFGQKEHPRVMFAHTIKGKGVSFMENSGLKWHYQHVDDKDYKLAMEELCR